MFPRLAMRLAKGLSLLLAGALLTSAALAQTNGPVPARVGWVAETQGDLRVREDNGGSWQAALRNRPVKEGDQFSTPARGGARLGFGVLDVYVDEATTLEFTRLDDDVLQLRLAQGRLALRVPAREGLPGVEVDTAEGRFTPLGPGLYRLERSDQGSLARSQGSRWFFRAGALELRVSQGQRLDVWRHQGRTEYAFTTATEDAWDARLRRDEMLAAQAQTPAVAADIPGVGELDAYGRWVGHPEHGEVWEPRSVPRGWAPYRTGQWVWVTPWGWTWVDEQPWGFAPFHFGQWVLWGSRWVWAPGPRQPRPIFHPRPPEIWRVTPSPKLRPPPVALPHPQRPDGRPDVRPPRERDVKPPSQQNPRPPRTEGPPVRETPPVLRSHPVPPPSSTPVGPASPVAPVPPTPPKRPVPQVTGPAPVHTVQVPSPAPVGPQPPAVRVQAPRAPAVQERPERGERGDRPERRPEK